MIQFKENAQTEGWKDGTTDGHTLFYRTLLGTTEGQLKMIDLIPPRDTTNKRILPFHHLGLILKTETCSNVSPVFEMSYVFISC